jgi:hypothetical protein
MVSKHPSKFNLDLESFLYFPLLLCVLASLREIFAEERFPAKENIRGISKKVQSISAGLLIYFSKNKYLCLSNSSPDRILHFFLDHNF